MYQLTVDFWCVRTIMFWFSPFMTEEQMYNFECEEGERWYAGNEKLMSVTQVDFDYYI